MTYRGEIQIRGWDDGEVCRGLEEWEGVEEETAQRWNLEDRCVTICGLGGPPRRHGWAQLENWSACAPDPSDV